MVSPMPLLFVPPPWLTAVALAAAVAFLTVCTSRIVQRALLYQPCIPSRQHEATPADSLMDFEDISLRAADGTRLHAWLLKQPVLSSRAPTVLFCHGNAGNISHALPFAKVIHGLGCNVLLLEYRGYGRSEGRPTEQGLKQDAMAAYEYCCTAPGAIGADKLVVYGRSLGGAVALALAAEVEARLSATTYFTSNGRFFCHVLIKKTGALLADLAEDSVDLNVKLAAAAAAAAYWFGRAAWSSRIRSPPWETSCRCRSTTALAI